jgi:hypothetical protein
VHKKTLVKKPGRSSPGPPNVEPDFGRFEDIGRLWVTMPIITRT